MDSVHEAIAKSWKEDEDRPLILGWDDGQASYDGPASKYLFGRIDEVVETVKKLLAQWPSRRVLVRVTGTKKEFAAGDPSVIDFYREELTERGRKTAR
jgi:hypothetical protein